MEDIKETMDRIRKQAEEIYNEKMKLLDEHKYQEIKQKVIDTKKAKQFTNIEDKAIISMEFIDDMQFLINVIDILEKKSKQDNETIKYYLNSQYGKEVTNKVQLSSLYGIHKERHKNVDIYIIIKDTKTGTSDIDFKNVNVEIKDKFIEVYNGTKYFNYNINEVVFYELRDSIDREYIKNDNKIIQDYIKNNDKIESEVE